MLLLGSLEMGRERGREIDREIDTGMERESVFNISRRLITVISSGAVRSVEVSKQQHSPHTHMQSVNVYVFLESCACIGLDV